MSVVVIGLSHRTSQVELRERFAFAESKIPGALQSLRDSGIAGEAVILSTCNRVEIYVATELEPSKAFDGLKQFLAQWGETPGELSDSSPSPHRGEGRGEEAKAVSKLNPLTPALSPFGRGEGVQFVGEEIYAFAEPQSLHHLFKVASGLDSMVLGETEILGQIKDAYALAHQHKHTGARMNKLFQRAFNVAKHIRTHTNIQRGSVSVASVAVELADKIFTSLAGREVLVIGAGETGEKVARALLSRGAKSIIVANRSFERAQTLAAELKGRAIPFDDWSGEFDKIDIAISSTAAPHHILDRPKLEPLMKSRRQRPLLLIDIAVPRDIDPAVNALENVYLYNIDDLQSIAADYLKQRTEEITRCEQIIFEKAKPFLETGENQPQMRHGPDSVRGLDASEQLPAS
jgi:glutamyl-tRNA reductase